MIKLLDIASKIYGRKNQNLIIGFNKWLHEINILHAWDYYSFAMYYHMNYNFIYSNQNKWNKYKSDFIIVELPHEINSNQKEIIIKFKKLLKKYEKLKSFQ